MPEEYLNCRDSLIEEGYSEEDAQRVCSIQYYRRHGEMPQQAEEKKWMKKDEREYLDSIADEIIGSMQILKSTEKEFIIYGPASVEVVDGEGEVIKMSAFQKALPQLFRRKMLSVGHEDTLVGEILEKYKHNGTTYKTGVEGDEFMVIGNVWADTKMAKKARKDIEAGRIRAYSISGTALKEKIKNDGGNLVNEITKIDLSAVTLCEKGMNPGARFSILKKMRDSDSVNSTGRQLEELTQRLKHLEEVNNMADEEKKGVEKDADKKKEGEGISLEDIMKEVQGLTKRLDTLEKSKEDTGEEKKPDEKKPEKKPDEEEKQDEEEEEAEDEETASKKKELDAGEIAEEVIKKLKKSGIIASGGPGKPDSGEEGTALKKEDDRPVFETMEDFYNKGSDTWKKMDEFARGG